MKRTVAVIFVVLSACLAASWPGEVDRAEATPQRRAAPGPTPSKYAKFTHKSHTGQVKSLIDKTKVIEIDCAYCHGEATRDKLGAGQHDLAAIGYPSHKKAVKEEKPHTACTECHVITGAGFQKDMCVICHQQLVINPRQMATNIRRFPNPDGDPKSQFYDYYSHGDHVDYFDQYAASSPLKATIKFFDSKQDAKANKGLDRNKFECSACHVKNSAPITVAGITFSAGVKMSQPGHPECFVCHFEPKIITPPKKEKPDPKNTFATNCTGCHQSTQKPPRDGRPVKGSELMPLRFARRIINTELNPARPGVKSPLPYSHKTHEENIGRAASDCISCHTTAKTATTCSDFYLEDKKLKEKQPPAWSCTECHKKEMQTKIEGTVTIETAKCNYCHSLQTIRELAARGGPLPPQGHFAKRPGPSPTPAPPAVKQ